MATKRQIEEQDLATANRRNAAAADIVEHVATSGHDPDNARGIAVGVLQALMEAIDGEATDVRELRRKGWQSTVSRLEGAGDVIAGWRNRLVEFTPAAGMPKREPVDIAVSHRADTPADLDARLEAAFQIPPPVRHIMTTLIDDTRGALCGGKDGSWTHPGGANCETCHALYAEQNGGPYAGPVAYNGGNADGEMPSLVGPLTINTAGTTPQWTDRERVDEPITPAVAREIREEAEAERAAVGGGQWPREADGSPSPGTAADVAALNIVEPTAVAVRPRMSAAQVRAHGLARQRGAEHRSVSQVEDMGDCGTRYALSDLERPAWWNVGGKALHRCVESINRWVAGGADLDTARRLNSMINAEERWLQTFDVEIADQHAATPEHPMSTWRAGKRGSEHYDWWRVEGPPMVEKYVAWLRGILADGWEIARAGSPAQPVIEFECRLNVGLTVPNLSIVDMALLHRGLNLLTIVDVKAGSSAPKSTFQLGVYGWALLAAGIADFMPAPDLSNIRGAYYRARRGELVPDATHAGHAIKPGWPVLSTHPWEDVVQRYRETDFIERQGVYMPNVTNFCGGCGVRDLCPAQAS